MNITEFRQQYPQYNDLSDKELADSLHKKYYSDFSKDEFYDKFGVSKKTEIVGGLVGQAVEDPRSLVALGRSGLKGATMGYSEKAAPYLAAGAAKIMGEETPYSELVQQSKGIEKEEAKSLKEEYPMWSLGGEITGTVLTPANLPFNKLAKIVGGGKGIVAASTLEGAVRGAGYSEDKDKLLKDVGKEAAMSGFFGLGVVGAGKLAKSFFEGTVNAKKGFMAKNQKDLGETAVKLKNKSSQIYEQMRNSNASLTKKAGVQIVNNLDDVLAKSGKINKSLHGDTMSVVSDIRKTIKERKIDLEELDQYRQLLNQVVLKNTDVAGSMNPDALKARILIEKIDDSVDNLKISDLASGSDEATSLLNLARSEWKVFKKYEKIMNLVEKADGDPNKIKSTFQRFVSNKKNLLGFNETEKEALKFASKNSTGEKLLKTFGKFGFDLGSSTTPGNTFLPATSLFASHLADSFISGLGFTVGGTAARQLQKFIARGKVDDALRIIEQGGNKGISKVVKSIPTREGQILMLNRIITTRYRNNNEMTEE